MKRVPGLQRQRLCRLIFGGGVELDNGLRGPMRRLVRYGVLGSRVLGRGTLTGMVIVMGILGLLQIRALYWTGNDVLVITSPTYPVADRIKLNTKPGNIRRQSASNVSILTQNFLSRENKTPPSLMNESDVIDSMYTQLDRSFRLPPHPSLLYGRRRKYKGILTIGIPSVRRPGTNSRYLIDTLTSIINSTSPSDIQTVVVVVFLCDTNSTYNMELVHQLYRKYTFYCDTGFIQITTSSPEMYPALDNVRNGSKESKDRVKWRTKQNVDFSILMLYCRHISDYYIHIEDDVITSNGFVTDIIRFLQTNSNWFLLEFSRLGFIGKLFKSSDLEWISAYLTRHFDTKPGDLLLGPMRRARGQKNPIHSEFSLFQHNGKYSSLKGKIMPSMDKSFKDSDKVNIPMQSLPKGDNPPAEIQTSFKAVGDYLPLRAYDNNPDTYCWSKTPYRGDYFVLKFQRPWNFSRIIISTGSTTRKQDSLRAGTLNVAVKDTVSGPKDNHCGKFKGFVDFVDGEVDSLIMDRKVPDNIICLKIYVTASNRSWLILREIVLIM